MSATPDATFWEMVKTYGVLLLTSLLGLFGWFGRRQVARIDALESADYVPRQTFDETVARLRDEIRQGNRETHKRLDDLMMLMAARRERAD